MCKEVIIIGASGHGKVVADIVEKSGDKIFGFLDDDLSKNGVIGKVSECEKYIDKYFVIAIGNNKIRKAISEKYSNLNYYTAVHPRAVISYDAIICPGTVIMANAVINSSVKIGKHCIINTASVVDHDSEIADFSHVSPGAILCGTVKIGECTNIGAGTVVRNNISIADNVVIGCGACVVNDIINPGVYMGVPAKIREK